MDAPLALYRRYRPQTFDEVIGQEHVTVPLQHALANNRVHHAYLFSGPRGCGKTTSARILARALNGHTDIGDDDMDIIEIDAASHGGVDDARDLREKAFFAPVNSPYKIYIIDEAHMVSNQGFNALLKLVEEPPPHLKFIFATTEPDKVIGTIRSRTHHYPFRLVPPKMLQDYLVEICAKEQVQIEQTALPMIVRAGAGSVRDTLSVLDQLMGGAGPEGVTYHLTSTLLGYTPDSLLDELIDGIAAHDGNTVFHVVDKVIETGQDPRRFTEDLLHRLRDLIIVAAVKDAVATGLLDVPGDRADRLLNQSARFGPAQLTRAADLVSQALLEFRGATAPKILLELMCMRILLPGADDDVQGVQARLDRLERRLAIDPTPQVAPTPRVEPVETAQRVEPSPRVELVETAQRVEPSPRVELVETAQRVEPSPRVEPVETPAAEKPPYPEPPVSTPSRIPAPVAPVEPAPVAQAAAPTPTPAAAPAVAAVGVVDVRRLWPDILSKVQEDNRFAWILLSQNAQVVGVEGDMLTISFPNAGGRDAFLARKADDILIASIHALLGTSWRVEAIIDPATTAPPARAQEAPASPKPDTAGRGNAAREAIIETSSKATRDAGAPSAREEEMAAVDASVDRNDPIIENEDIDHQKLLEQVLGAKIIDESGAP